MIQYNNYKLPKGLEYVGDGWTVRKTTVCYGDEAFNFMKGLCKHLIAHPDPMIVPVYSFEYLGAYSEGRHRYSYDMMRLGDISRHEADIIWDVGDAWRSGSKDPLRIYRTNAKTQGEKNWQEYPKLMGFLQQIIQQERYYDLHGENIMMDTDENYRIIDLEGFSNPPLSNPSNAWITREEACPNSQELKSLLAG